MINTIRAELFAKYLQLPTAWYERESSGPMLSRLTYNAELVADAATNSVTILIRDSLTIGGLDCLPGVAELAAGGVRAAGGPGDRRADAQRQPALSPLRARASRIRWAM